MANQWTVDRDLLEAQDRWVAACKRLGLRATRDALRDRGLRTTLAASVAFWLADGGPRDQRELAFRYRRLLVEIGEPPPGRVAAGLRANPGYRDGGGEIPGQAVAALSSAVACILRAA